MWCSVDDLGDRPDNLGFAFPEKDRLAFLHEFWTVFEHEFDQSSILIP